MKTTTQETQALEAVMPAQSLLLLQLAQLRPSSKQNVRKGKITLDSIAALIASIERIGLLQNLAVVASADGEHYEVVAGNRRLAALRHLQKKGHIPQDYEVPCVLLPNASARTASLTENLQRESMHPADQFEAFAALIAEGRPIEDIAADFSVTPLVVQRRLKLANVSPRLLSDYRAGTVTLEQLMALAITDDHTAQEAAFYDASQWQRSPAALRTRLTELEIDAHRHPLARFVGVDAYEAAGGATRRDLFADDHTGLFLMDAALLTQLAKKKLEEIANKVQDEGWAWVDTPTEITSSELQAFARAPIEERAPNAHECERFVALEERLAEIEESDWDELDGEEVDAIQAEAERIQAEMDAMNENLRVYSPAVLAMAGAIITVDRNGLPVVLRGLLREAEAKALRELEKARAKRDDNGEKNPDMPEKSTISSVLARHLSAHRTTALQIELARHPHVALAAMVHGMVRQVLQCRSVRLPLHTSVCARTHLEHFATDVPDSQAVVAMQELKRACGEDLPMDSAELFDALLALSQDELVTILAVCVASSVDVVVHSAGQQPGAELARAVDLDMRKWWTPTAEGYFQRLPKAAILKAVQEFAPAHVARLSKHKKGEIAKEAERLVAGTGWMPECFRTMQEVSVPNTEGDTRPHDGQDDTDEAEEE